MENSAANQDMSEWADWAGSDRVPDLDALAQRQRYERHVAALWREVKSAILTTVKTANGQVPELRRVECGDSPTGGLALTRWSAYPVAFLDVSVDVDSGMIGCLYTVAVRDGDPYREVHKVWLMRGVEAGLVVTDDQGRAIGSSAELAQQVVDPYLSSL